MYSIMGGGNVDMWTCGMIACMYIVFSCSTIVVLVAHL